MSPVPVDHSRPALRVYGSFEYREEAVEHAKLIAEADPNCSLVLIQRDKWTLLPMTERIRDDPREAQKRVDEKVDAHRRQRTEEAEQFERALKDRAERPPPKTVPVDEDEIREQQEAEALVYKPPRRLRSGAEVRGQAAFAICVIPDEFGECLVKILGVFETTSDAESWVQGIASRKIIDHDIFVGRTCEWIYPNAMDRASQDRYRHDELQRIMDASAKNPKAVRDYKEWKKEQDRLKEQERFNELEHEESQPSPDESESA